MAELGLLTLTLLWHGAPGTPQGRRDRERLPAGLGWLSSWLGSSSRSSAWELLADRCGRCWGCTRSHGEGRELLGAQLRGRGLNPAWAGSAMPHRTAVRLKDTLVLAIPMPPWAPHPWREDVAEPQLPTCSVGLTPALTRGDVTAVLADFSDFNIPALRGCTSPPWARQRCFPLSVGPRCQPPLEPPAPGAGSCVGHGRAPRRRRVVHPRMLLWGRGEERGTGGTCNVTECYLAGFAAGTCPGASNHCFRGLLPVAVGRAPSLPV